LVQSPLNIFENPIFFHILQNKNAEEFPQIYLLIHGWTGNESSMSIFLNALPKNNISIFPRGIFNISAEQYGWVDINKIKQPIFSDFEKPADILYQKTKSLISTLNLEQPKKINIIGFSQGAAIASVLAIKYSDYFQKICLLSGFLPENPPEPIQSLDDLEIFISHGSNDEIVPVHNAHYASVYFKNHGASVKFCEETVGHKIGANCSLNLKKFLSSKLSSL